MIGGIHTPPRSQKRGTIISTPEDGARATEGEFVQCCHCQRLWLWVKGSGKTRGWCMKCGGVTCGSQRCDTCVPAEKMLDLLERGIPFERLAEHANDRPSVSLAGTGYQVSPGGVIIGR